MKAGLSVKHLLANQVRVDLDDHGYGDIEMREEEGPNWTLYREGTKVGSAFYNLDCIVIEIKP